MWLQLQVAIAQFRIRPRALLVLSAASSILPADGAKIREWLSVGVGILKRFTLGQTPMRTDDVDRRQKG